MNWKTIFPKENRFFETNGGILYNSNSIDILKQIPNNTIDTVICDPPYGLSKHSEKTIRKVLLEWLNGNENYVPKSKGFMGQNWDAFVPPPALWKEVYRVMKAGGTILVFAGTRTYDLMTISLRLAGFEIKDTLMYLYGIGFPKAIDISKLIDKKFGAKRKIIYSFEREGRSNGILGKKVRITRDITTPSTSEAKQWSGYKSHSLKPAYEPIIMAMKPNEGSYADNALKWGVAGLNIFAGRIPLQQGEDISIKRDGHKLDTNNQGWGFKAVSRKNQGRFPANLILDEESAKMLDEQSGKAKSRFFYTAKASKKERNFGLENMPNKIGGGMKGTQDKTLLTGSGNIRNNIMKNNHPTVKPLKLIEYLVRLTSMPNKNQVYLDPFLGSGTTAMVCKKLNKKWIGIEISKDYCEIAKPRIEKVEKCLI